MINYVDTDIVLRNKCVQSENSRKKFDNCNLQIVTDKLTCDVVADAFLDSYHKMNAIQTTAIAFFQAGAVRVTLPKGRKHFD